MRRVRSDVKDWKSHRSLITLFAPWVKWIEKNEIFHCFQRWWVSMSASSPMSRELGKLLENEYLFYAHEEKKSEKRWYDDSCKHWMEQTSQMFNIIAFPHTLAAVCMSWIMATTKKHSGRKPTSHKHNNIINQLRRRCDFSGTHWMEKKRRWAYNPIKLQFSPLTKWIKRREKKLSFQWAVRELEMKKENIHIHQSEIGPIVQYRSLVVITS